MNSIVVYCVSVSCPSFIIFSFDGSLLFLNFVLVSIFLFFFSLICCVRFVSEWLFSHILPSCVRWNTTVMANCYGTNCYIKCVTPVLKLYNLVEFEKFQVVSNYANQLKILQNIMKNSGYKSKLLGLITGKLEFAADFCLF